MTKNVFDTAAELFADLNIIISIYKLRRIYEKLLDILINVRDIFENYSKSHGDARRRKIIN